MHARSLHILSCLPPLLAPSSLPQTIYIPILVRVFFSWHAHESGPPRWARRSMVLVRFFFCK